MKKITNLFSLKYIFPIFIGTFLINLWYEKTHTLIIENGVIQNPNSFMMILGYTHLVVTGILLYVLVVKFIRYVMEKLDVKKETEINTSTMNTSIEVENEKMGKQEPSLQQQPRVTVWKILAAMMKIFLGLLLLGFFLVAIDAGGDGILLLLWPIAMFALPALFVYLIASITSKALTVTGIQEKPDSTGNQSFLGKDLRKTFRVAIIILFVSGLLMFLGFNHFFSFLTYN